MHIQDDHGDHKESLLGQKTIGTTGGTSGMMETGRLFTYLPNQNNPQCNMYNYYYASGQYLYTNLECYVYGKKGYIYRNCFRKGQLNRHQGQSST